jgi:26S proteasome regulatory subunit T3
VSSSISLQPQAQIVLADVSRPDRLSSAEIASIVQAAGLQGGVVVAHVMHANYDFPAVRKNRYVILPIDFEEAWKVGVFTSGLCTAC